MIPIGFILSNIGFIVKSDVHPITRYSISDGLCHFSRSMALNTIPSTDIAVIIPKITQPSALSNKVKQTGIYVPNINKNIEQWSSI